MDTTVADGLIGALIDGRYRIRGRVARGGMATVYTAVDHRLERTGPVEGSAAAGSHLRPPVAYGARGLVPHGPADPLTDGYAAGIVLFEMLTGRVPYEGGKPVEVAWRHVDDDVPPPSKFVAGLPPQLDDLVARATRRDPGGRPTDAGALLAEVQATREDLAANAATSRVMPAPTVTVASVNHPTQAIPADRPPWARLPGQAGPARVPAARPRAARQGGLVGWYHDVTATARGRQAVAPAVVGGGLLVAGGGRGVGGGPA